MALSEKQLSYLFLMERLLGGAKLTADDLARMYDKTKGGPTDADLAAMGSALPTKEDLTRLSGPWAKRVTDKKVDRVRAAVAKKLARLATPIVKDLAGKGLITK